MSQAPIKNAIDAAFGTLKALAGASITYRRGPHSTPLTAPKDSSQFERDAGEGISESYETTDFLIAVDELIIDGERTFPKQGDVIEETDPDTGQTYTYRTVSPTGEKFYSYAGGMRRVLRVHTVLTGIE